MEGRGGGGGGRGGGIPWCSPIYETPHGELAMNNVSDNGGKGNKQGKEQTNKQRRKVGRKQEMNEGTNEIKKKAARVRSCLYRNEFKSSWLSILILYCNFGCSSNCSDLLKMT